MESSTTKPRLTLAEANERRRLGRERVQAEKNERARLRRIAEAEELKQLREDRKRVPEIRAAIMLLRSFHETRGRSLAEDQGLHGGWLYSCMDFKRRNDQGKANGGVRLQRFELLFRLSTPSAKDLHVALNPDDAALKQRADELFDEARKLPDPMTSKPRTKRPRPSDS